MNKTLTTCAIIYLSLSSVSYASQDIANEMFAYSALTATRHLEQSTPQRVITVDGYGPCGICRQTESPVTEYWLHPFGNRVHSQCLKTISGIEKSTVKNLERVLGAQGAGHHYHQIHRLVIMFVNKLCYPATISDYIKNSQKRELERFFSHATNLGVHAFVDNESLPENFCGICGHDVSDTTECCTDPYCDCIYTDESTIKAYFGKKFNPEMYRAIIEIVAKLCFPETIEDYIKNNKRRELERYFSHAITCVRLEDCERTIARDLTTTST